MTTFFDKEKYAIFCEILLESRIKSKTNTLRIRIQLISVTKKYVEFKTQKQWKQKKKMVIKMEKHCTN